MLRVHVRYERTGDKATQRSEDVFPVPSELAAGNALAKALADPHVASVLVEREPDAAPGPLAA